MYCLHSIIILICSRYVILENDLTDIAWLLQELENIAADSEHNVRYQLTSSNLTSIIQSLDTEYDRNALKAIIFATRSHKEVEALGIKADRAVHFLKNSCQAAEECQNALVAAEDMLELRLKHKKEVIEEKMHQIDEKIAKLGDLLPAKVSTGMAREIPLACLFKVFRWCVLFALCLFRNGVWQKWRQIRQTVPIPAYILDNGV